MPLTGAMLKAIAAAVPGGSSGTQVASWDKLAADANTAGGYLGFTTVEGFASFIANCCQESGYFRTTTEYGAGGNSYSPYDGRTFIQVTWQDNYAATGKFIHGAGRVSDPDCFVNDPPSLAHVDWAWWGPAWYFTKTWGGETLVQIADRTKSNLTVARAINTGDPYSSFTPYGMNDRNALFNKAKSYGADLMPTAEKDDDMPKPDTPTWNRTKPVTVSKDGSWHQVPLDDDDDYSVAGPSTLALVIAEVQLDGLPSGENVSMRLCRVDTDDTDTPVVETRAVELTGTGGSTYREFVSSDTTGKDQKLRVQVAGSRPGVTITRMVTRVLRWPS